ncbi:MAG TPA: glycosyltransferase family 2 protein, partial [Humisphaera sp.]|nr:glycosyltransferase family 2 protein [Humisphaera sp.]
MNVAIVILIWNGKKDTLECLASLRADAYLHKQIIVVDNGSTDGSADEIRASYPEVTVLQNKANLGFCAGNNIGIEYALNRGFDYVYLLNNDTTVEPRALTHLMQVAEANPRFGIVAPVMHDYKGTRTIWFAGSRINLRRGEAVHDNSRQPVRTDAPYTVPWITGCALIARADLLRQLGGLDERYFLSWEDVDLGLRTTKAGWELAVVPAARIYHKGGQTSGRLLGNSRDYYDVRNRLLLLKTHCQTGYHRAALYVIARNLARPLREPGRKLSDRFSDLRRILAGIRDHLLGRYGQAGSRQPLESNVVNRPAP